MLGGQFLNISSTTSFKLSDLSVSGYDPDEGAWGELQLIVLTPGGIAATDTSVGAKKIYCWHDNEERKGWFQEDGETAWDGNTSFDAGQGFWIQGEGLTLCGSGAVNFESVTVNTPAGGNAAVANPYPCAITLGDISVSGYDPVEGAWGELQIMILTPGGVAATDTTVGAKKIYCWHDNEERVGWFQEDGETAWADTYSFPAGQGFWVQGEGLTMEFTFPATK